MSSSLIPSFLKPLAARALELALNRLLALDPDTYQVMRMLDGQRIALYLETPPLELQIRVEDERLRVGPIDSEQEVDLKVQGTLAGFLGQLPWLAHIRRTSTVQTGRLRVAGDAELAQRLQQLATRFDPDWQQPFVAVFGELLGVQVAGVLHMTLRHMQRSAVDLAHSTAEFITEESGSVVPRAELEAFYDDVDVLRDDVERLATRLVRLCSETAA
ncbi:SCP2 domain-containing protein [Xylella taiwanensis]|uniref:Ubiquinone biosynthesis accessory factor UbiJ n=1 Tax=Xylella taiwanensis TaxID=1444770 RepID=Z9JI35_9GAMM|nr:SCP2 sterol-binding domain-containing protein [Xylella taiwanensis]AXI83517.1 sterol-binding protein [Xylella taiwanensis]EWS78020.1 sterol-binding protein [Xylella taiwanensis]MCD8456593.1 SCP2 sterol-binding domain-containing protein [Xylella taiwanensis]MCD8459000.1 SCP2 sterol-binding domain-containing protein [Xylella taiwanensis]MCD8461139.1 SCP2 sterol-binding domain-containing protein [Xylella taiwanensis]